MTITEWLDQAEARCLNAQDDMLEDEDRIRTIVYADLPRALAITRAALEWKQAHHPQEIVATQRRLAALLDKEVET